MAVVYIGPRHGEGGVGDTAPAGADPVSGVAYGTSKQILASIVADQEVQRAKLAALLAKLDADAQITATDWASSVGVPAALNTVDVPKPA